MLHFFPFFCLIWAHLKVWAMWRIYSKSLPCSPYLFNMSAWWHLPISTTHKLIELGLIPVSIKCHAARLAISWKQSFSLICTSMLWMCLQCYTSAKVPAACCRCVCVCVTVLHCNPCTNNTAILIYSPVLHILHFILPATSWMSLARPAALPE